MNIAVLASGGVDSSFVLHKLKNEGHKVTAHYLKIWNPQYAEQGSSCPWQEDVDSVKSICDLLNIPMIVHNLQIEYEFTVMAYMLEELKAGRTPNPDVYCNPYIKFGAFFDNISFKEYDYVASGHYATKDNKYDDHIYWHKADPLKDQSFFLSKVSTKQFSKIIFPCSGLSKKDIRDYAEKHNLPQKDKKDSQGLCFIGKVNYSDFISKYLDNRPGTIINSDNGEVVGEHEGLHLFTIGQRHGLYIENGPWYVSKKDSDRNILYVINRLKVHTTMTRIVPITKCNWNGDPFYIKYKHPQIDLLKVESLTNEKTNEKGFLLEEALSYLSFSPGQVVAVYDKTYKLIGNCLLD